LPNPASAHASTPGEIDAAFATLRQRRAGALLVGSGTFFPSRRQQIVTLAARDAIPAMYSIRPRRQDDICRRQQRKWMACIQSAWRRRISGLRRTPHRRGEGSKGAQAARRTIWAQALSLPWSKIRGTAWSPH